MADHTGNQIKQRPKEYRYQFLKQSNQKALPSNALLIEATMKMSPRVWWSIEDVEKETHFPLYTATKPLAPLLGGASAASTYYCLTP